MALFGVVWGAGGAAFVASGISLMSGAPWWIPATAGTAVLSLLDWRVAYMGALVDLTVLAAAAMAVMIP